MTTKSVIEESHDKNCGKKGRAYLGRRMIYQARRMAIINQGSESMDVKGEQELGNHSGAEEENPKQES